MTNGAIEALVQKVESFPDPDARRTALDLVQAVMDLHASGLERMMEILSSGSGGDAINALASDGLVGSLLLLHDLHPLDLETRAARALERSEFRGRGASVELISTSNGIVRVRIDGGPGLRAAVEAALLEAVPDAAEISVQGGPVADAGFVPLTALLAGG